jgi:hypothetical protein
MGLEPGALLKVADTLARPTAKGAEMQAQIRRSVSTSYYAVFVGVQRRVADGLVGATKRSTVAYAKAVRSLDHKSVREIAETLSAFDWALYLCGDKQKSQRIRSWLDEWQLGSISPELSDFAENFWQLHAAREKADYDPNAGPYVWATAETMLRRAQDAVDALKSGKGDDWSAFASHLVFGIRRR